MLISLYQTYQFFSISLKNNLKEKNSKINLSLYDKKNENSCATDLFRCVSCATSFFFSKKIILRKSQKRPPNAGFLAFLGRF